MIPLYQEIKLFQVCEGGFGWQAQSNERSDGAWLKH